MKTQRLPSDAPGESPAAFRFVQELASELSLGTVELPGFPDVALRVQRALADPEVTADRLLQIVGAEPVLAGRVMQMANSAALTRSGGPAAELRTAINRLGFDLLRGTVISYAMEQVKRAPELRSLARPLHTLWERSVRVAAMCRGLARRCTTVNPDTAMLAGLLHSMGRLYILVRSNRHPQLFADPSGYQSIVQDWHAAIARALLENWGVPDDITQAVAECEDPEREHRGAADLTDVLAVGCLLATHRSNPSMIEVHLKTTRSFARVGLKASDREPLLREADDELEALQGLLGSR